MSRDSARAIFARSNPDSTNPLSASRSPQSCTGEVGLTTAGVMAAGVTRHAEDPTVVSLKLAADGPSIARPSRGR
jgi:hypothetical protein